MLIDIGTGKEINFIPFKKETFDPCIKRLSQSELDEIKSAINKHINDSGTEVQPAGWIPGNDWTNTSYGPIYSIACKQNQQLSAKLFGILVWVTIMERDDKWSSGKGYEAKGVPIESRVYFRVD